MEEMTINCLSSKLRTLASTRLALLTPNMLSLTLNLNPTISQYVILSNRFSFFELGFQL